MLKNIEKEIIILFDLNKKYVFNENRMFKIINFFIKTKYSSIKDNFIIKISNIDKNTKEFDFLIKYKKITKTFKIVVKRESYMN